MYRLAASGRVAGHARHAAGAIRWTRSSRTRWPTPTSPSSRCGSRRRRTIRRLAAGENPGPEVSVDKVLLRRAPRWRCSTSSTRCSTARSSSTTTSRHTRVRHDYLFSRSAPIYGGYLRDPAPDPGRPGARDAPWLTRRPSTPAPSTIFERSVQGVFARPGVDVGWRRCRRSVRSTSSPPTRRQWCRHVRDARRARAREAARSTTSRSQVLGAAGEDCERRVMPSRTRAGRTGARPRGHVRGHHG